MVNHFKMIRIGAWARLAEMIKLQPVRNRADHDLMNNPMHILLDVVYLNDAIAW